MSNRFHGFLAAALITAGPGAVFAAVPDVAVDIPPVHSLVARVMEGVGEPDLVVQPGASPHGYSLRPSEARALNDAELVFWVGEGLTPWFSGAIGTLAEDARAVELLEAEGTLELPFREGATFEAHDHEGEDDHDEAGTTHEGHEEGHDHHGADPHAWLDPANAYSWLGVIAEELARADPENAATYRANAAAGQAELDELVSEIDAELAPFRGTRFIVFHDAYQYFENRFGVTAAGAVSLGDASDPSPARIAELRGMVAELSVTCAFSEPQFNPGLFGAVFDEGDVKLRVIDPLGTGLEPGPELYPRLLRDVAASMTSCL